MDAFEASALLMCIGMMRPGSMGRRRDDPAPLERKPKPECDVQIPRRWREMESLATRTARNRHGGLNPMANNPMNKGESVLLVLCRYRYCNRPLGASPPATATSIV